MPNLPFGGPFQFRQQAVGRLFDQVQYPLEPLRSPVIRIRHIRAGIVRREIQQQAKDLADLLATLDVAVSEARKLKNVTDAISSGDANKMAQAMLLALAQLDPDWPVRASDIQAKLFKLSADSFPAINELASGKVTEDDVTKALVEILFAEFLAGSGNTQPKP